MKKIFKKDNIDYISSILKNIAGFVYYITKTILALFY